MTNKELKDIRTMTALQASMNTIIDMAELLKTFADKQQLKFSELDTLQTYWSFDDRLIFKWMTDTESIFSTKNEEELGPTLERMFGYIVRGVQATAYWRNVRIDHVRITQVHWHSYNELVLTYDHDRTLSNG
jgi:hypothetical protein